MTYWAAVAFALFAALAAYFAILLVWLGWFAFSAILRWIIAGARRITLGSKAGHEPDPRLATLRAASGTRMEETKEKLPGSGVL